ncbi:MAG: CoA-binding protein [Blastocatellia bacterium]
MKLNEPETIDRILGEAKTIAVVGLSSEATRASNSVSRYMQSHGYRIIPVNPNETSVLGEKSYAQLEDVPEKIDVVNIFRRSDEAGRHVDEAIRIGATSVWMQEGVVDEEAAVRASEAGLAVVMGRCILKEHLKRNR